MRTRMVASLLLTGSLLAGCGYSGLYNAPLPGGADVGARPYQVTAEFADVLDLVPQASVRLGNVPVGRVTQISLTRDGSAARVQMLINGDIVLPADADAQLSTNSLLGEKFVELDAPAAQPDAPPPARLRDGAVIPLARTSRYPQVEEVLAALSLLLNGGGIAHLQQVVRELNAAAHGNEPQLRALLSDVTTLTTQLDSQRDTIVRAIDGLGRLSTALAAQNDQLDTALHGLGPGIQTLNEQRDQLVDMLHALDKLSGVAVSTVNQGRDDLLANVRALQPTLEQLARAGDNVPKSLEYLLSYPWTDQALKTVKGDYVNTDVVLNLNFNEILGNLSRSSQPLLPIPGTSSNPLSSVLPKSVLPDKVTKQLKDTTAKTGLNQLLPLFLGGGQ
jgi:phospholipid/cholesterol/gamma-HCH transport system substrate-binding protein